MPLVQSNHPLCIVLLWLLIQLIFTHINSQCCYYVFIVTSAGNTVPACFWVLYYLLRTPQMVADLRSEVARVCGGSDSNHDGLFTQVIPNHVYIIPCIRIPQLTVTTCINTRCLLFTQAQLNTLTPSNHFTTSQRNTFSHSNKLLHPPFGLPGTIERYAVAGCLHHLTRSHLHIGIPF